MCGRAPARRLLRLSCSNRIRTQTRSISAEEMTERMFLPMVTEASRCLTEGIVREPGELDMGLILGIGFPPFRGGLLRWADDQGLAKVLQRACPRCAVSRAAAR